MYEAYNGNGISTSRGTTVRMPLGTDEWRAPKIVYNRSNHRLEQGDTYDDENNRSYHRMEP